MGGAHLFFFFFFTRLSGCVAIHCCYYYWCCHWRACWRNSRAHILMLIWERSWWLSFRCLSLCVLLFFLCVMLPHAPDHVFPMCVCAYSKRYHTICISSGLLNFDPFWVQRPPASVIVYPELMRSGTSSLYVIEFIDLSEHRMLFVIRILLCLQKVKNRRLCV